MRANGVVAARAPTRVCVLQKQFPIVRKVVCRIFARLGACEKKLAHRCVAKTRWEQTCCFANRAAHQFVVFRRQIERVIMREQFLHDRRPERRCCAHSERVAHRSSIEVSRPNGDRVFPVKPHCPGVAKTAACSSLRRDALLEGERRMQSETFLSRLIVAQNVCNDRCRFFRGDAGDRLMFRCEEFRAHGRPAAGQSSVGGGKIHQTRLGISQNKTGTVMLEALWKIEAPLLQLIERWTRAELAQHKYCRHV